MVRRLPLLLLLFPLALGCATSEPSTECVREADWVNLDLWDAVIEGYEADDLTSPPATGSVVFIGSSSVWYWETLSEDMAPIPVLNRGFGGSVIAQATQYLDRVVFPYQPSAIVLYAGENDVAIGSSSACVAADFEDFAREVRSVLPSVPIYFISLKPSPERWDLWTEMRRANTLVELQTIADASLHYIDVSEEMLDPAGLPVDGIFLADGIHLNAAGYEVWTSIIQTRLAADLGY